MSKNKKDKRKTSVFITNPLSQPDNRDTKTNTALPDHENVSHAKDWVDYNKK